MDYSISAQDAKGFFLPLFMLPDHLIPEVINYPIIAKVERVSTVNVDVHHLKKKKIILGREREHERACAWVRRGGAERRNLKQAACSQCGA